MALHGNRGRACCPEHERKIRGKQAAVTAGRNRAIRAQLDHAQKIGRHRRHFREVAMGTAQLDLLRVFGALPHPDGPRHGETLAV
jgi:hypothetical protein